MRFLLYYYWFSMHFMFDHLQCTLPLYNIYSNLLDDMVNVYITMHSWLIEDYYHTTNPITRHALQIIVSFLQVTVPDGKDRDRKKDLLVVRDKGNTFKIISSVSMKELTVLDGVRSPSNWFCLCLQEERDDPTTVIEKEDWNKTRDEMEKHLRKLRDFSVSNWF